MEDYNITRLGYDTTFELDKFSKARLRPEIELIKNTVLFILFSKPGQYPSLPFIGLNIQNMLYSFYDEINNEDLKAKITTQCNALGLYFDTGVINIRKIIYYGQPSLLIHIESVDNNSDQELVGYGEEVYSKFQIGITFDEIGEMIYSIDGGGA